MKLTISYTSKEISYIKIRQANRTSLLFGFKKRDNAHLFVSKLGGRYYVFIYFLLFIRLHSATSSLRLPIHRHYRYGGSTYISSSVRQAVSILYLKNSLVRMTSTFCWNNSGLKFLRWRFTSATNTLGDSAEIATMSISF